VSLDATERSVRDTIERGCRLLVVHHPAIFQAIERLVLPSQATEMISAAITGGISVYSAHTNWDSSPEGVNVILAGLLGLNDVMPLVSGHDGSWGMGAIGRLGRPETAASLARLVKEAWGLSSLMVYEDGAAPLCTVALCGGAGGDLIQPAIECSADVFITADVSYHNLLHAQLTHTRLIVVNHGEMERASLPGLCDLILDATGVRAELLEDPGWVPRVIGPTLG
jgi:dinuclear metal center YbgI/SA1388 family protein